MRALLMVAALGGVAMADAGVGSPLTLGPIVQDVGPDHVTLVFETAQDIEATSTIGSKTVTTKGVHHEARVTGLAPETRANWSVSLGGSVAASGGVTTAPPDGAARPLVFVVYGDNRNGPAVERDVVTAIRKDAPSLALHTGDMVPAGGDDEAWRGFFANETPLMAEVPVFPAVGNHELHGDAEAGHLERFFAPPAPFRETHNYTFRWGDVRFIALDGNSRFDEQATWLEGVLKQSQAEKDRHVFVFMHQPPLSTGNHCGAGLRQERWVSLFERYGVRAVFAGHDHAYERLSRNNIRYFISGGGGAPLYGEREDCPPADQTAREHYASEYHYLLVKIVGDEVTVTAQRLAGGAPIEVVRFRAGEKMPLTLAAPALAAPPVSRRAMVRYYWWGAAAVTAALLCLVFMRRKRS
jgi:hypothetical protein